MIKITFPDGNSREYESGVSSLDIAKSLSNSLAKKILAAKVNDEVWDAFRPINEDATIELKTWQDDEGKSTFWHSSAHIMAEALEALYPGVKLGYVVGGRSKIIGENDKKSFYNTDIRQFHYGLTFNFGYNTFNIHIYYALNYLFDGAATETGEDINLKPLRVGLIFYIL